MDSLRSILVHMDAGRHATERLAFARALAAQHEARLDAVLMLMPRFVPLPLPVDGGIAAAPLLDEVDEEHRKRAKARFDRAAAGPGWPVAWQEVKSDPPFAGFVQRSLHADLLVLGQHDPHDSEAGDVPADFAESVLFASGKPALIVPPHGASRFNGLRTVLVAWQPSREAARAMAYALPLLRHAAEVHVVTWSDDTDALPAQQQDVLDHLHLHGVHNAQPHRGPLPADAGAALLTLAEGVGADLLVMGCYGHSRARELVLGGASRGVLRHMRVPVLMAH